MGDTHLYSYSVAIAILYTYHVSVHIILLNEIAAVTTATRAMMTATVKPMCKCCQLVGLDVISL